MMTTLIINPQLCVLRKDKFTTGIVYLPITIAAVSANFKKERINHSVVDLFGSNPFKFNETEKFEVYGEENEILDNQITNNCKVIFIFANQIINHYSIIEIIKYIKKKYKNIKICILENTQAVTAYSLKIVQDEFFKSGADFILCGEPELQANKIYKYLNNEKSLKKIPGLLTKNFKNNNFEIIKDLDKLDFPNWDQIPLENYWKIGHAHGPLSSKKYLSIYSSRGCPYPCTFCVVPLTNDRQWRSRSANNIVNEIEFFKKKYNISEFHFEDLNPTVNDKKTKELCKEIIKRNIKITWKICSGTKVESILNEETVKLLAESGCKYISISPESGSKKIMDEIKKPFKIEHAYKIIKLFNKYKIFSQACFVLGFPGENLDDLKKTKKMIIELTKSGIDEIALFIITPVPGSKLYDKLTGYKSLSELNFTPTWRNDYKKLKYFRLYFYFIFLLTKLIFFPKKIIRQILNFFIGIYDTKMEMVPRKYLNYSKIKKLFNS